MKTTTNLNRILLATAAALYAGQSLAWDTSRLSEREIGALPKFCQVHRWIWGGEPVPPMLGRTVEQREAQFEQMKKTLGWDGYMHTHHYCWGLGKLNRYYQHALDGDRKAYLEQAVNDASYTLTNAPKSYVLYPEILTFRAKVFGMLDKLGNAVNDLQMAIKLNPKYERAYVILAEIYHKNGQSDVAKTIIQQGLKMVPNSKILVKRLAALNGKPNQPATPTKQP